MAATIDRPSPETRPAPAPPRGPAGLRPDGDPRAGLRLRLLAFAALALFSLLPWYGLVDPRPTPAAVAAVVLACGLAVGLSRLRAPRRRAAHVALAAGVGLLALPAALLCAGVPLRFFAPGALDELVVALAGGTATTPGISMPYRGADEWVRIAILAGGGALLGLAAALVAWPRRGALPGRPVAATAVLGVLYAVPVVERSPGSPFLSGAVFAVLAAALLWAERLEPGRLGVGAACVVAAALLGLAVAPVLDRDRPLLDYEQLAESLEPETPAVYRWDHAYGPLDWPREGRELLRVKSGVPAYWKATTLDEFDGVTWRRSSTVARTDRELEGVQPGRRDWVRELTVSVRNVQSRNFVAAGSTLAIRDAPAGIVDAGQGTFLKTGRPLRRGATYTARVFLPQPGRVDLRSARAGDLDRGPTPDRAMQLPPSLLPPGTRDPFGRLVSEPVTVVFPAFGTDGPPTIVWPEGLASTEGAEALLRSTPYGRWYDLARGLAAESGSQLYGLMLRVQDRVQRGASYTETPQGGPLPLDTFLFETGAGYCQHFSGAMALLLRMAGVPARVATGFSPGSYDRRREEHVVRDVDAHSWVEAYLPGIGWHTMDPTPGQAPARSQQQETGEERNPNATPVPDVGAGRDLPGDVAGAGTARQDAAGSSPLAVAGVAAGALLLLLAAGVVLHRRGRVPGGPASPETAELERALHRSGRRPRATTTLHELERTLRDEPEAAAYLRAVREQRFAGAAHGPGPAARQGLRRALRSGLGWRGRVRALWAVPPVVRRGRSYTR